MNSVVEFFLKDYEELTSGLASELYLLRRKTFHERLNWKVQCNEGMETDQFDNKNTKYLLGMHNNQLLCGARFIDSTQPTMISEIFQEYFDNIRLPDAIPCCEVSRLFLDKDRRDCGSMRSLPVSKILFLAMILYCIKNNYKGMYAVASRGMYAIFRQANWKIDVIQKGISEKGEIIYYIFMPANLEIADDIINKDKASNWLRDKFQELQIV